MVRKKPTAEAMESAALDKKISELLKGTEKPETNGKGMMKPERRAFNCFESFSWCVRGMLRNREFKRLVPYVSQWWRIAYGEKMIPEGELRFNDVYRMIQYQLLVNGFKSQGLPVPEVIRLRHGGVQLLLEDRKQALKVLERLSDKTVSTAKLFEYEDTSEVGQIKFNFSNFSKEDDMALKKKSAGKTKTSKKAPLKRKQPSEKKPAAKAGGKAAERMKYAASLIADRKMTDAQIVSAVGSKFKGYEGSPFTEARVAALRRNMNNGERESWGYKKPAKPYEKIEPKSRKKS